LIIWLGFTAQGERGSTDDNLTMDTGAVIFWVGIGLLLCIAGLLRRWKTQPMKSSRGSDSPAEPLTQS